ncbi:MAG: twin-arginine translocase subunit TatC [Legionella sp.]|nr:twin-arginine translocase subunit TatC [Legionella sp.]
MLLHLLELRRRTILTLIWFIILFVLFFFIANDLFAFMVKPLLDSLPHHTGLIATQITSAVLTPLKLALNAAMILTSPVALYHLWCFISPGLYKTEQHLVRGAILTSMILFIIGVLFCFYFILPFMFQLFHHALPQGVQLMPDMAYALDFITRMLTIFGFCFQLPLICQVLVRMNIVPIATLKNIRPYVIVGSLIVGMLLTPPDVISQIMLAVPLYLLYEAGILLGAASTKSLHRINSSSA